MPPYLSNITMTISKRSNNNAKLNIENLNILLELKPRIKELNHISMIGKYTKKYLPCTSEIIVAPTSFQVKYKLTNKKTIPPTRINEEERNNF